MSWRAANSLLTLSREVNSLWPSRNKASDGLVGDAAHRAVKSEHNPNAAGVVTAMDITHDTAHGADMNWLAERLIKLGDPRIWYIIFNRRIWQGGRWQPYYGSNPHDKHLHLSTAQTSALYDDGRAWNLKGAAAQEDRMDNKTIDEFISLAYNLVAGRAPGDADFALHRKAFHDYGSKWAVVMLSGFEKNNDVKWRKQMGESDAQRLITEIKKLINA